MHYIQGTKNPQTHLQVAFVKKQERAQEKPAGRTLQFRFRWIRNFWLHFNPIQPRKPRRNFSKT